MRLLKRFLQTYLTYGFPLVVIVGIWQSLVPERTIAEKSSILTRSIWEVLSWNVPIWFTTLAVFFFMLLLSSGFRTEFISKVANIKERDEREAQITGEAAKNTYIVTLAAMIFFLFVSTFSVSLAPIPAEQRYQGKTQALSISARFRLYDQSEQTTANDTKDGFRTSDYSPSAASCLMALIAIQILSFRRRVKRETTID